MNRLLSILVAIFVLFLLYIWINHLISSPDKPAVQLTSDYTIDEQYRESNSEDDYPLSNYEGKKHIQEIRSEKTENPAILEEEVQRTPAATQEPGEIAKEEKGKTESRKTTSTNATYPDGEHLVIAGNFIDRANAQKRADELKSFGFSNAEVVNFELSEYHTVCAGRFTDINEARRIARKIKDFHSIDSYVRNGNKP